MPHVFTIDGAQVPFGVEAGSMPADAPVPVVPMGTDPRAVLPSPTDADSPAEWWKRNHDIAAAQRDQYRQQLAGTKRNRWFFLAGGFIGGLVGGLLIGRFIR